MPGEQQFIPRVNQIDAIALDKEITQIITENFLENIQAIAPKYFIKVQPELNLLIQTAIWLGSIGKQYATFGQQLLLLAYDSKTTTRKKLALHYCLTILPTYLKSCETLRSSHIPSTLMNAYKWMENVVVLLRICNLFRFLKNGRKPLLVDFILSLDYINLQGNQQRRIGYDHMTRELLWGGFIEMLGLLLSIINFRKIQRLLKDFKRKNHNGKKVEQLKEMPKCFPNTLCGYCNERPTLPHYIDCGHIYCYYCLAAHLATDSIFYCTKCDNSCVNDSSIKAL